MKDASAFLRRLYTAGSDEKLLQLAQRTGKLTEAQVDEARAERERADAPLREIVLGRQWLDQAAFEALEGDLRSEDMARAVPSRAPVLPVEVEALIADETRLIGDYVLVAPLGRGGAAEVWRAWDRTLARWVALKLAPPGSPASQERFRREALAAARLNHQHIVAVYRVGEDRGRSFIAMQLVDGRTLSEAHLPLQRTLQAIQTVASALAYAHANGVVHRDLKPHNVMIDSQDRVWLVDFGLVHVVDGGHDPFTVPGEVMGTAAYMAPEQAQGMSGSTGPALDVYGLGATLYELATGQPPFRGSSFAEIVHKVVHETPMRPRRVNPALGTEIEAVILKAMEKEPASRYASAAEFADDLGRLLEGKPVRARPAGPTRRLWSAVRRNPVLAATAVAMFVAVASALVLWQQRSVEQKAAVEAVSQVARISNESALRLRRSGDVVGMRRVLERLRATYEQAGKRVAGVPEVEYVMGRTARAALQDAEALAHQQRALATNPNYLPALYERIILLSKEAKRLRSYLGLVRLGAFDGPEPARAAPKLRDLEATITADATNMERLVALVPAGQQAPYGIGEGHVEAVRGIRKMQDGKLVEARDTLRSAVNLRPNLEEAWDALGETLVRNTNLGAAVISYTRAIELDRGYLPYFLGRAQARLRIATHRNGSREAAEQIEAAMKDLDAAIALEPSAPDAWLWRGSAQTSEGDRRTVSGDDPEPSFAGADRDFGEALAKGADPAAVGLGRGVLRFLRAMYRFKTAGKASIVDYEEAEADITAGLAVDPRQALQWRGRVRLGRARLEIRLDGDPREDLRAADEDFAGADAVINRGMHAWMGYVALFRALDCIRRKVDPLPDLDDAEKKLEGGAQESWSALMWRGRVRTVRAILRARSGEGEAASRDFDDAESDFSLSLKKNDSVAETWARRGIVRTEKAIWLRKGKAEVFASAERDLETGLRAGPRQPEAWAALARLRRARGDNEGSRQALAEATRLDPAFAAYDPAKGAALIVSSQ